LDITGVIEAPPSGNTIDPHQPAATSGLTDAQRKKVMALNETLVAKKARVQTLEKMGVEERLLAKPGESMPMPKNSEQQRIQREREMQRDAVTRNVTRATLSTRAREINSLRKDISAIEAEIALLQKEGK